jgi:diketogulonate reductase-like aldo/keto reductase
MEGNFILNNDLKFPTIGFGTWRLYSEDAYDSVLYALKVGYRKIDTVNFFFF